MKKKTLSMILALATAVSVFAACPAALADEGVTLAVVGPMTGDNAEYGKCFKTAAQIAIDEWNANGGVLGQEITLVDYDDANASEQAASIAEKLVGDDSIKAVLGHFSSGVAMTAAEIYQDEGLALVNGSAAHMDFAKIGDCIYRNNAIYTTDANTMLQIMEYLGVKKFGILNPNSDAGIAVTTAIESMVEEYGDAYEPELVLSELYEDGTVDFSAVVSKFQEAGVEAIYSSGAYAQMAPFISQYREKDSEVKMVLSAGCFSQEFLELAGDSAEGVVLGTSFFYGSEDEKVKAFTEKFNEAYGANPNTFAGQIYDATYAILYAMEAGGATDRETVVENLPATDFEGVTGKITFDEEGNCPKQQVLLEIKDGQYQEIPGVLLSQTDWEATKGIE
ncbi:MAG: ABC transporter substrate-binding protein [Candidatus Choladocola sp.]|nr:ABC transporter substrate-binding protein [Candidatus Choladocola sp.]